MSCRDIQSLSLITNGGDDPAILREVSFAVNGVRVLYFPCRRVCGIGYLERMRNTWWQLDSVHDA